MPGSLFNNLPWNVAGPYGAFKEYIILMDLTTLELPKETPSGHGECSKRPSSKAAGPLARGAYTIVREHANGPRTPLADFFNIPPYGRLELMHTWSSKILLVMGAVILIVGLNAWLFEQEPVTVKVVRAEIGRVEETITNSRAGTVKARQRAHLSAEVGGRVVAVPFDKGDTVKQGDLLLRLNDASERAKVERAKRDLVVVQAERNRSCLAADRAKREHVRFRDLAEKELVSINELDRVASTAHTTEAACEAASADVHRAQAAIEEAKAELDKTMLYAPFSGILGEVQVDVGEWITPAPPGVPIPAVLDLINPQSIYISAPMDEVDSAKIHPKQEVRVTLDPYPGQHFTGYVVEVSPYVNDVEEQNRTVDIEVELQDREFAKSLLPGTSADVEVIFVGSRKRPSYSPSNFVGRQ